MNPQRIEGMNKKLQSLKGAREEFNLSIKEGGGEINYFQRASTVSFQGYSQKLIGIKPCADEVDCRTTGHWLSQMLRYPR